MKRNVDVEPDLAAVSFALSQPGRCAILQALMGGVALPASKLAYQAGISTSSTSAHLKTPVNAGLIRVTQTGRHRYYELTRHVVAEVVEALSILAPKKILNQRKMVGTGKLRHTRLCYDHLAGNLGVTLTNSRLSQKLISRAVDQFELTPEGFSVLTRLGVDLDKAMTSRRCFARPCIDWSECQAHLAGSLGAALTNRLFELSWIGRCKENRSVSITSVGYTEFERVFDISQTRLMERTV